MGATTIQTGSIKYAAGKIFHSQYEGKPGRRSVTVEWNGSTADCWFEIPSDLEFLKKGDQVMFSVKTGRNGKADAEIHLSPELAAELQRRRGAATGQNLPPSPSDAPPVGAPPPENKTIAPTQPLADRWSKQHKLELAAEIEQRAAILGFCLEQMRHRCPDSPDHVQTQLAIALYSDAARLF